MLAIASLTTLPTSSREIPSGIPSIASWISCRTSSAVAPSGITIPEIALLTICSTCSGVAYPASAKACNIRSSVTNPELASALVMSSGVA